VTLSLIDLGGMARGQGDYARARALHEESLALCRDLGQQEDMAISLCNLGLLAHAQGDYARARDLHEESLALFGELGDMRGTAISLIDLGSVTREQGDYARARALFGESLAVCRKLGDKQLMTYGFEGMASVARAQGATLESLEHGARLFGTAAALREAIGAPVPWNQRAEYDRALAATRRTLGDAAFEAAWAEGRAMSLEQALSVALGDAVERSTNQSTGGAAS
jgi:non-specific serine/threonine protein kinase